MVERRIGDGRRIAELLASEVDGREDGPLSRLSLADADPEVEPTTEGALAYRIEREGEPFAAVFVQPDRVRIEFQSAPDRAAEAALEAELRVRPKAVEPPKTLVFVENGAAVKRATDVLESVAHTR
ncbi:hypothetical protein [Natronorarus salvus]|uniref:hypothetical protein n=1 Tax=Natronorarus salvus TaxID=3117733 RepID=UPI002F25F320